MEAFATEDQNCRIWYETLADIALEERGNLIIKESKRKIKKWKLEYGFAKTTWKELALSEEIRLHYQMLATLESSQRQVFSEFCGVSR